MTAMWLWRGLPVKVTGANACFDYLWLAWNGGDSERMMPQHHAVLRKVRHSKVSKPGLSTLLRFLKREFWDFQGSAQCFHLSQIFLEGSKASLLNPKPSLRACFDSPSAAPRRLATSTSRALRTSRRELRSEAGRWPIAGLKEFGVLNEACQLLS